MLVLSCVVCLLLFLGIAFSSQKKNERLTNSLCCTAIYSIFCCVVLFILCIYFSSEVIKKDTIIDQKIAMYEEENARIESQVTEIVNNYMAYEGDIFKSVHSSSDSSLILASIFPELKSDELVGKQVEVYITNKAKIKALKEEKIELGPKKWILYFGG